MTKKDLKSGYVVVDKNDSIYMVVKDCIERDILLNKNIALQLSSYENDLTHEIDSYTIQKVLQPKYYSSLVNLSTLNFEYITLYDRENSTVNYNLRDYLNAERANVDELNIVRLGHTVDIILKYTKSKKSYLQAVATYMDDSIFNPDDCDVNTEFVTINIGLFITRQFALLYKTLLEDDSLMNYITEKEFVLLCESIYDDVFYMFYHEH